MSSPQSTGPQARAPLWYCHECHAEMRPLMEPDPHCASCHGTFVEMIDDGDDDDPRSFARENETAERMNDIFLNLAGLMAAAPSARSPRPATRTQATSPPVGTRLGEPLPGQGAAGATTTGRTGARWNSPGNGIRIEFRSGIDTAGGRTRSWAYTTGGGPQESQGSAGAGLRNAANLPTNFPSFPEFVARRVAGDSVPNSPGPQNEIETPFGPMSPEASARLFDTAPGGGGARNLLMQYLLAVMTGQTNLLIGDLDELNFPFAGSDGRGTGAFGDYVFTQEGLDRIVTELMEAAAAQHRPNPAPEDVIEKLSRTKLTYESDLVKSGQSCAICTEYFAPPDPASAASASKSPDLTNQYPPSEAAQGKAKATEEANTSSGVAIELPCHHAFHDDCIITWLKTSGTCPVCRYALVEQPSGHAAPGASAGANTTPTFPANTAPTFPSNAAAAFPSNAMPSHTPSSSIAPTSNPASSTNTSSSPSTSTSTSNPSRHQRSESTNSTSSAPRSPQAQAQQFFHTMGGGPVQMLQNFFGGLFHDPSGAGLNGRSSSQGRNEGGDSGGYGFRRVSSEHEGSSGGAGQRGAGAGDSSRPGGNGGNNTRGGSRGHFPGGYDELD